MSEDWERLERAAREAGRKVAWKWPEVIEAEDIAQEILMVVLESPSTQTWLMKAEYGDLLKAMVTYGNRIASKELDSYQVFTGQVFYSTGHVRYLLENGVLDGHAGSSEDRVDLQRGLEALSHGQYSAIMKRYFGGEVPERDSADRKQLNRSVDALTANMNRSRRTREEDHLNRT